MNTNLSVALNLSIPLFDLDCRFQLKCQSGSARSFCARILVDEVAGNEEDGKLYLKYGIMLEKYFRKWPYIKAYDECGACFGWRVKGSCADGVPTGLYRCVASAVAKWRS